MPCNPTNYCSASCADSCRSVCRDECNANCIGFCEGGCLKTCTGCSGSCTGCSGSCSGKCTGSCTGKCNFGCKSTANTNSYNSMTGSLSDYIQAQQHNWIREVITAAASRHSKTNGTSTVSAGTVVDDAKWNALRTVLLTWGSGYDPGAVSGGGSITKTQRTNMINKAKSAFNLVKGLA